MWIWSTYYLQLLLKRSIKGKNENEMITPHVHYFSGIKISTLCNKLRILQLNFQMNVDVFELRLNFWFTKTK